MNERILIVDDEQDICDILQYNLQTEGYTALTAASGEEALAMLSAEPFDLVLLDVMMDGISGFEVAKRMKEDAALANIPIIFCTAKAEEGDVLDGFSLGSDDYITKPFRLREVKARVKAVLRRREPSPDPSICTTPQGGSHQGRGVDTSASDIAKKNLIICEGNGDISPSSTEGVGGRFLVLDTSAKTCHVDGEEVTLTKLEYELLALLLEHPHTVFSREEILTRIWPSDTFVLDRTVDVNITRLRKKIGQYGKCIRTRFGYGYSFEK